MPFRGRFHSNIDFIVLVGSTLCAAAPSSTIFFIGRAVAAVGSAGLIQGALAIVTFVSPLEKRPTNLAIVVSIIGISTPLGPVLGGVLTDRVSWRWCFWMFVLLLGPLSAFEY